ncbi:Phage repressor protein C, contains Cro/C1-type HTH and peptisase s24 domains [bacterium A37T11]|nr:Phage repressor protein C, contains Cro/C1-type HTH and peptisase s24 domains [bacterium A37T11]
MTNWKRLEQVIHWSGLSTNAFALSIGLKRAENLYQIKKGNNAISQSLAAKITKKYTTISRSWLLTGDGHMLTDQDKPSGKKIPYYESGFSDLNETDGKLPEPSYFIEVPLIMDAEFAIICVGNSMQPEIPAGSIVTLKEISKELILPGETYFVVTKNYSTIKTIRTVENDPKSLRLIPKNLQDYDEAVIPITAIIRLFLVKGMISTKIL